MYKPSLVVSFILSFLILLLLPLLFQKSNFQIKAQPICEIEGGNCYPAGYICSGGTSSPLTCNARSKCYFGGSCHSPSSDDPRAGCPTDSINTAFGCIGVGTTQVLVITFVRIGMGLAGGTAFILIVYAGFMIMTSSGDPKRLSAGKELLTAAIGGLILLILGTYFLNVVGTEILGIFS